MTFDEQSGDYTLSSGRTFSAFTSTIGLSDDGGVTVGGEWVRCESEFTAEERAELADEMIRRWTAFKAPQGTHAEQVAQAADALT